MVQENEIKDGDHFWALYENVLHVFIKEGKYYFIAGGWEGDFEFNELKVIQIIQKPTL